MPSPVRGFTREAASPTSSTGPSGCRGRHVDSGRWWARSDAASAGWSGSSVDSEPCRWAFPGPAAPEGRTQLSVADVGRAVPDREGPPVGGPSLGDHLDEHLRWRLPSLGQLRIPAHRDRQRMRRVARDAQGPAYRRVRAVRADDDPGGDLAVERHVPLPRAHLQTPDPVPDGQGAALAGGRVQAGVEDPPRDRPGRPSQRDRQFDAAGGAQPHPVHRAVPGCRVRHTQAAEGLRRHAARCRRRRACPGGRPPRPRARHVRRAAPAAREVPPRCRRARRRPRATSYTSATTASLSHHPAVRMGKMAG